MNGISRTSRATTRLGLSLLAIFAVVAAVGAATPPRAVAAGVTVTTVAGTAGATGDKDGLGPAARFSGPYAVACDAAGNVYVADTDNNAVRKITSAGNVSTIAGAAADLSYPQGVACDAAGNVYVADTYHHVILKITPGGSVSTLAGLSDEQGSDDGVGAAARFCYPAGLACDAVGNVYVADTENSAVRKITPDGRVTTLAGPAAGLASPMGVACNTSGGVYVADTGNNRVVIIAPDGAVSEVAAATGALSYPGGVACDAAGIVYVADTDNDCIRALTASGSAVTLAGSPDQSGSADGSGSAARFSGPQGLACDPAGNVYVADTANSTVRKLAIDGLAPVTTVSPGLAETAASGWRTSGVTLTLTATDAGSSVASTFYTIDGGAPVLYNAPFAVSSPGSHLITYYSVDAGDNTEAAHRGFVNIDGVPPVTVATPPLSSSGSGGWMVGSQIVTLTATDELSGVARTTYSVDGGPVTVYTAPFTVSGAGSHAVVFSSVDVAGNVEAGHTVFVNIDGVPPVTTATPELASGPTSGWRNSALTVTLSAKDAGAGVARTDYSVDGAPAVQYSAPFVVSAPGSHLVAYSSVDALGAVETTRTGYVNIDTTVPRSSAAPASVRAGRTVTLKFRVDDDKPDCGSASVSIQIRKNGRTVKTVALGVKPMNAALTYRLKATLPRGSYTWRVPATDVAGNRAISVGQAPLTVR